MKSFQQLIKAEVSISIPDDMILINKVELEELIDKADQAESNGYAKMDEFEKLCAREKTWIKNNLFKDPNFLEQFDMSNNNEKGFVRFPRYQNDGYRFKRKQMIDFVNNDLQNWM
ncbi:hypothetical protein BG261_05545 [Floricoccus tropicus]|uniref:DUF771 domain-containing protein n=1 Tax=Floricoccus tropicus TaxID=1859473 RepID=A0A1E8GMI7_9LACT|nr:DUF771 domain-containing protein [Floricoccus tropicus]OFI48853.1 hypothetical protein BG261_05545 [Floricoccus tropicus]